MLSKCKIFWLIWLTLTIIIRTTTTINMRKYLSLPTLKAQHLKPENQIKYYLSERVPDSDSSALNLFCFFCSSSKILYLSAGGCLFQLSYKKFIKLQLPSQHPPLPSPSHLSQSVRAHQLPDCLLTPQHMVSSCAMKFLFSLESPFPVWFVMRSLIQG